MKKKYLIGLFIFALFTAGNVMAQKATLTGTVTQTKDGAKEPIPFANVFIVGSTIGGSTDFDGKYNFSVDPGTYTIVVSSVGLTPDTNTVTLAAGEIKTLSKTLSANRVDLKIFEKVGRANRESEKVLLMERKDAKSIGQNMGARELQSKGATTVSDGLQKVAGLAVVGSRHVSVRGMGDRYNSAYLNGMPLASPDPDKKVIPLDIFPTSVVKYLNVRKSFTPNLYGDFSGGAIDIHTKDYPDEPTFNVSVGGGYNSSSTFKDVNSYEGGGMDYFGIDDGTRDVPASVENVEEYSSSNESGSGFPFGKNLDPKTIKAPINSNFGIFAGNFYKTDSILPNSGIGVMVLASHRNSTSFREGSYRVVNRQDAVRIDYDVEDYQVKTNSSALGNILFRITPKHEITFNTMWVNLSSNQSRESDGFHFDYERKIFSRRYTYRENNLLANQVLGSHSFMERDRLKVTWGLSSNKATSKEPDRRQMVWLHNDGDDRRDYIINDQDVNDNHRFFSELDETEVTVKAEVTYAIKYDTANTEKPTWTVTAGLNNKSKERNFDFRQFNYIFQESGVFYPNGLDADNPDAFVSDEFHSQGAFAVTELFNAASDYVATRNVSAAYFNTSFQATKKLQITPGVRIEDGEQVLSYRDQNQPIFSKRELISETDILPSLLLKYDLTEKSAIKMAGSNTISRPGFKEVAPFQYIEFAAGRQEEGNPELQNGKNYNADVRYEIYPASGDLVAVTVFGKSLQNPIERVSLSVASGQLGSYANTESAVVAGVEFEFVKKLSAWADSGSFLEDITLGFNASYLYSQVTIDTTATVLGASLINTNPERPLQGASPYLVNVDVSYEKWLNKETKLTATVAYNVFGKRLFSAGVQGIGDIYEAPVNMLNLILRAEVGDHWGFNVSAKNLLNPSIDQVQEAESGDIVVNSFRTGINAGFGITYKFL